METKIREVVPMVAENWVNYSPDLHETQLIQPVAKSETDTKVKAQPDKSQRPVVPGANGSLEKTKELAAEIQSFLEDFNIQLSFKVHEKTGDLVVQVINRDTGDMIRQIPSENLVKLHEKLVELRGVLFEGKV